MLRLLYLFVLFLIPCSAHAANSSDIGEISRMVSEVTLVVPKRINIKVDEQSNILILTANFKSNIILNSLDPVSLGQIKIGSFDLNNKSQQEIVLGEESETIYIVSPE